MDSHILVQMAQADRVSRPLMSSIRLSALDLQTGRRWPPAADATQPSWPLRRKSRMYLVERGGCWNYLLREAGLQRKSNGRLRAGTLHGRRTLIDTAVCPHGRAAVLQLGVPCTEDVGSPQRQKRAGETAAATLCQPRPPPLCISSHRRFLGRQNKQQLPLEGSRGNSPLPPCRFRRTGRRQLAIS